MYQVKVHIFCFRILFFLLGIASFQLNAQEFSITGILSDTDNTPLEGSEVVLLENKKIISSGITDSAGFFSIQATSGIFQLRCYFFGEVIYATDFEANQDINLGNLTSFDSPNLLSEVEIISKRKVIETQIDRTVFNVENSIRAVGSDGFELLKASPGVIVQGNNINIVGKSSVRVMVDDRIVNLSGEDLNSYLRSLSSENIKSIEIITTPPAKYDAEGNSGLINIRLKKAPIDSWSATIRGTYLQYHYPYYAVGAGINYNKNKFSFNADLAKQSGSYRTTETYETEYAGETWNSLIKRRDYTDAYRGLLGFEYKVSSKATIGTKYIGLINKPDINDVNTTHIFNSGNDILLGQNTTRGFNNSKSENNSLNVFYTQQLDTLGKALTLDLDYFTYKQTQDRNFASENVFNNGNIETSSANNNSLQKLKNYSAKLNFDLPYTWANINFGGKISFTENISDIAYFDTTNGINIADIQQTNDFDYTENTQSVYVSINKQLSEKWQAQAGIRYENTQTKGITTSLDTSQNQTNTYDYDQWFPSAYLLYTANENNSFSASYNKRIGRPDFWWLNPFKWYFSPYLIIEGNPFAQPSFTDNFELGYNYKETLLFKLYYSHTSNGNYQIPFVDYSEDPAVTRMVYDNLYDSDQTGATITSIQNIFNWWESTNTLNGHYNKAELDASVPSPTRNGFVFSASSNNSFTLNNKKNLMAEANFSYNSKIYNHIYETTPFNRLDLGLRYSIREKGLSFYIYGFDVFRSSRFYRDTNLNNTPQKHSIYFDERMIRVGLSYKFGNKKLNASYRESGNEEEKNRTR
ncbi:MAG: outer membrane beta-barrel family protein [Flavobacteriaceae bacterium]|jgi:outer membrane receptor protein involved in Fe transport|nr:outer membrane beta-barrel family protein [Flavobacteriaceae bacterium]